MVWLAKTGGGWWEADGKCKIRHVVRNDMMVFGDFVARASESRLSVKDDLTILNRSVWLIVSDSCGTVAAHVTSPL